MATSFPSSLDSFTNPLSSDTLSSPSHSAQHANVNDAVEALQAKVGADSSAVTSSLDYKVAQLESDVSGLVTGKILQVLQTVKTDVFSASSSVGVAVAVTGLTVTITPSSASSKVLVSVNLSNSYAVSDRQGIIITRGGSTVTGAVGDAAGSRQRVTAVGTDAGFTFGQGLASFTYLDSPASTSALTYGVSLLGTDSRTHYVNRPQDDANANSRYRTASFITVMEVGA